MKAVGALSAVFYVSNSWKFLRKTIPALWLAIFRDTSCLLRRMTRDCRTVLLLGTCTIFGGKIQVLMSIRVSNASSMIGIKFGRSLVLSRSIILIHLNRAKFAFLLVCRQLHFDGDVDIMGRLWTGKVPSSSLAVCHCPLLTACHRTLQTGLVQLECMSINFHWWTDWARPNWHGPNERA